MKNALLNISRSLVSSRIKRKGAGFHSLHEQELISKAILMRITTAPHLEEEFIAVVPLMDALNTIQNLRSKKLINRKNNMSKKIYISGNLTDKKAKEKIRISSHYIQNTLNGEPYHSFMFELSESTDDERQRKANIATLMQCDAIYMLKGWEENNEATTEHYLAKDLNMEIIYEE